MTGHTPWRDIEHKASPEKLAAARAELDRVHTEHDEPREPTAGDGLPRKACEE